RQMARRGRRGRAARRSPRWRAADASEDIHRDAEEERPRDPADGELGRRQGAAQRICFADRGDPAADRGADAESAAAGPASPAAWRARPAGDAAMIRRGFTLLEVMIAIAVLAMIGGLTWKSFDGAYALRSGWRPRRSGIRRCAPR